LFSGVIAHAKRGAGGRGHREITQRVWVSFARTRTQREREKDASEHRSKVQ
jgi:hypothetical protein